MENILIVIATCFVAVAPSNFFRSGETFPVKASVVLLSPDVFMNGTEPSVRGIISFTQTRPRGPVYLDGYVQGLSQGKHGIHVHQFGNLLDGCLSAGPHFNPDRTTHGAPTDFFRHVGDLGNIVADKDGRATVELHDHRISLSGRNGILGRSLVIHSAEDDYGNGASESKTTGNAGGRVACGVIGVAIESPVIPIPRP